jgi:hypothetical protein
MTIGRLHPVFYYLIKLPLLDSTPPANSKWTKPASMRHLLLLGFWAIPVFLIPVLWPAYAILTGDFEGWKEGVLYQIDRGERDFAGTVNFLYQADPILLILGGLGIVTATVLKKI